MIDLVIILLLLLCGLIFGKRAEKKHYESIKKREEEYKDIINLSDRDLKNMDTLREDQLLLSEGTVVSIDYFKKLMAWFVNIFGGRMKSYESLVDRARREAVLRVKEKAAADGYNCLANLRIETSSITKGAKGNVSSVEALAYATAVKI